MVWARKSVRTQACPKSYVTAESLCWLEEFHVWRAGHREGLMNLETRKADAFLLLEAEMERENNHAE